MKFSGIRLSSLFLIAGIISILPSYILSQERIVGGTTAAISTYPYMVALKKNGALFCGGSLVTNQFVVTAAHCLTDKVAGSVTVVGGTGSLSSGGISRSVSKIIRPTAYNANTQHMDVAVLKLKTAMTGTNIGTISIATSSLAAGKSLMVVGWGRLSETGGYPVQLRKVLVTVISTATCKQQYGSSSITNSMMCAQRSGKDACSGDSGGPGVYNGKLYGIVSWGYGCARDDYAGVYTDVSYVKTFINNALKY